jgi:heme/copper-type cytochrome/quinol oxidase subunit 2
MLTLVRRRSAGGVFLVAGAAIVLALSACSSARSSTAAPPTATAAATTAAATSAPTAQPATATAALAAAVVSSRPVAAAAAAPAQAYNPRVRNITLITFPIAAHEQTTTFPYLTQDFAAGGVLDGKEVYGFYPSTIVAYAGDSLNFSITNPQDDAHTFTIPELEASITVPGQTTKTITIDATRAGIYNFLCEVGDHQPYMWGQLVVLPDTVGQ